MTYHDLSQPLESGMPVYPGSEPVTVEQASTVDDGARVTAIEFDSHAGTHVDAPSHVRPDGATLDEFDLSAFAFDARLVDCTHRTAREPIAVADVEAALDLPLAADVDLLAFHTGWDAHWGSDRYRDHPYLSGEVAGWCAERELSVGIDAFSPDPTPGVETGSRQVEGGDAGQRADEPDGYPAHDALLGADCRIVENLTALDAVDTKFELYAFPLSLPGGDGAPVRAVGVTSAA